jgi:hypothetical protein
VRFHPPTVQTRLRLLKGAFGPVRDEPSLDLTCWYFEIIELALIMRGLARAYKFFFSAIKGVFSVLDAFLYLFDAGMGSICVCSVHPMIRGRHPPQVPTLYPYVLLPSHPSPLSPPSSSYFMLITFIAFFYTLISFSLYLTASHSRICLMNDH